MVISREGMILQCSDPPIKEFIVYYLRKHRRRALIKDLDETTLLIDPVYTEEVLREIEVFNSKNAYYKPPER